MSAERQKSNVDPTTIDLHGLVDRTQIGFDYGSIARRLSGRKILVTGAGGSIGSALCRQLMTFHPAELVLFEHHEFSLFNLLSALPSTDRTAVHGILGDVRDRARVARTFRQYRPDIVFHLAAYKHVPIGEVNPDEVIAVNLLGTLNVLEEAAAADADRLVFSSTDKAVDPPSIYGATKRSVELLLGSANESVSRPRCVVVRLVNTVGAQGGVIRVFAEQIVEGRPVTITDPTMTRYWISMAEATGLLITAAVFDRPCGILLLDMGQPVGLMTIVERLWDLLGSADRPLNVANIGMRAGERLHEYLTSSREALRPTHYPGIVQVVGDGAGHPPFGELAGRIRQIGMLLSRSEAMELRQAVFDLAQSQGMPV